MGGGLDPRRMAPVLVLVGAFALSRIAALVAGVRFNAHAINYASQLADPELLSGRLLETVWYLHSQPPGFNLLVGSVLAWSPFDEVLTFHFLFLGMGLALMFGIYDLSRQVGVATWPAVVIAVIVGASPAAIIYENWLSYEQPVAVMLVWLAAATARWVRGGSTWALAAVTCLAAAAVLTRSLLHPLWLVAVVVLALAARRPRPALAWAPVLAVVLPALLVGGVLVKNQVLFGSPTLSSWMGFNLNRVVLGTMDSETHQRYLADGTLTAGSAEDCEPDRGEVPVLAEELKRDWRQHEGIANHNWECLLEWYDALWDDAVAVIRDDPGHYARAVAASSQIWVGPSTHYPSLVENRQALGAAETLHRRGLMLSLPWNPPIDTPTAWGVELSSDDDRFHVSLTTLAATLFVIAAGAVVTWRWRRDGLGPARAAVLMGSGTVAYVALVSNLFEHGENNRIRYVTEPLTLTLAAAIAVVLVGRWLTARRQSSQ